MFSNLFFTLTNLKIGGWLHNNRKCDYITLVFLLFKKLYFLLDSDFLLFCNIFAFSIMKSNWGMVSILHFRWNFLKTKRPQKGLNGLWLHNSSEQGLYIRHNIHCAWLIGIDCEAKLLSFSFTKLQLTYCTFINFFLSSKIKYCL